MNSIAHGRRILKGQLGGGAAALAQGWSAGEIDRACRDAGHVWRERFWTPMRTLWAFLLQVLHDGSCREAVALVLAEAAAADGLLPRSADPSAYGQARKRLPLEVLRAGVRAVGRRLREEVSSSMTWCGRRIWLVDGSTCSMPDTPELQAAFGQPGGQAPGCGFPVAKVVALFCWASGAVVELAIGALRTSELALWRRFWAVLAPGEIVLADRFYCTFYDFVGVMRRGCDAVLRLHQARPADMRQGRCLGPSDRLVTWLRPTFSARPRGTTQGEWEALPEALTVRLIRFAVDIRGFRSHTITVATTLLDPVAYPAAEIAALYRDRWLIELRLRDLKTTMGMEILRGKSADVVCKEIYMHLLAYNLIRRLMWQAASRHGRPLHRLSFAGTVDRLKALAPYLMLLDGTARGRRLYELLLRWTADDLVPHRPNRVEPRAVKRRPKEYDRLNRPRHEMREALVRN